MSLPSAAAVTGIRYTSTAAIALIVYDHLLTVNEEIAYIWKPDSTAWPGRAAYLVYRYFTEGVLLYSAYEFGGFAKTMTIQDCLAVLWIFVLSATLFVGILQFIVTVNVYRLWDSQPRMANILMCVFALCFSATISLAVASTALITKSSVILHVNKTVGDVCLVGPLPRTVPAIFGALLSSDLFIIGLSLYRALEMPRRSQSELITNIQRDGALYHIGVSVQWLVILVASIHLDPYTFFSILTAFWSLNACIGCRLQLRLEGIHLAMEKKRQAQMPTGVGPMRSHGSHSAPQYRIGEDWRPERVSINWEDLTLYDVHRSG